jgi:hypothetical protein
VLDGAVLCGIEDLEELRMQRVAQRLKQRMQRRKHRQANHTTSLNATRELKD